MCIEYVWNTVGAQQSKPFWEENYFGLTFEQDPRPRCSLIIGDGFSQSFLGSQGLRGDVSWSINDHFPPPSSVLYVPVEGDRFGSSPLWDSEKWPRLYSLWEGADKIGGRDFYLSLYSEDINPHRAINRLTYNPSSVAFELRCYLWHLFRAHHYQLFSPTRIRNFNFNDWEWLKPFMMMMSEFALGISSFNYDLIVENFLKGIFNSLVVHHDLRPEDVYLRRPVDSIALYKLHGSISYYLNTGMSRLMGRDANPWMEDIHIGMNQIVNSSLELNPKMEVFPEFPDIVPPGHYGEDKISPLSTVLSLSKSHIALSKVIIFCGLSADEPDTDEVRELVSEIKSDTVVIQVGLSGDEDNSLSKILMDRGLEHTFLLPDQLNTLADVISTKVTLHRDWSTLYSTS